MTIKPAKIKELQEVLRQRLSKAYSFIKSQKDEATRDGVAKTAEIYGSTEAIVDLIMYSIHGEDE